LRGDVEYSGGENGAVESAAVIAETAAIPDKRDEEDGRWQELVRTGEKCAGVARGFRRQAPQRGCDEVSHTDDGQQSSGNLDASVARTWKKMFDQESRDEEKGKEHAADPPRDRREQKAQWGVRRKVKEKGAGSGENGAGKKKAGAEDQGDAVLGALKADERDGGEDKGEQRGDGLKIAVKSWIGLDIDETKPSGDKEDAGEPAEVDQKNRYRIATVNGRSLAHVCSLET